MNEAELFSNINDAHKFRRDAGPKCIAISGESPYQKDAKTLIRQERGSQGTVVCFGVTALRLNNLVTAVARDCSALRLTAQREHDNGKTECASDRSLDAVIQADAVLRNLENVPECRRNLAENVICGRFTCSRIPTRERSESGALVTTCSFAQRRRIV